MIRTRLTLAAAALALAVGVSTAEAQRPKLSLSAGAAVPSGDLSDAQGTGWSANLGLDFRPAVSPLGLRAEGMWHQLDGKGGVGNADFRVAGLTGNLVYEFPGMGVRPYVIGGGGLYNHKLDVDGADSENDFGLNGGLGVRFPLTGFETYVEARFHNVFSAVGDESAQFVPIVFGVSF